ncbi:MAG: hypothetical protein MUE45_03465 [Methanoregulaceae archaeon]|jgi:hypothetical protein|nr:hypothetical protein [Methanoregulaceae archaeon]MCU0628538.1 hypothetical protein [Methanoregulaceae archaeon]
MIFPRQCKEIGIASTRPCGDQVYFLSRYLIHDSPPGFEVLEVTPDPGGKGLMREVTGIRVLAGAGETWWYPEKVQLHDRALLVRLASESGKQCTIFTGIDEHTTFVCDPDPSLFQKVAVYDVIPPRPSLSACIRELEEAGMFSELDISFEHTLRDISQVNADIYPCRASGFVRTLDADLLIGGERVAGCLTATQFLRECYGGGFDVTDICPLSMVAEEPFITRCCRKEREGIGIYGGKFGAVVHWGASPYEIFTAVKDLLAGWRGRK